MGTVIVPPPGSDPSSWESTGAASSMSEPGGAEAVLAKVRALLAQAESTTFEAEAEVFTAKAQELMAKHAIDAALVWSQRGKSERPSSIRLAVDDPYANEQATLLHVVARNSRAKAVQHGDTGLHSVFGFPSDLAAVDLLYTSLLVQAQTALRSEAAVAPPGSRVRGAAFKRAFLYGYAIRIDERLGAVTRAAEDDAAQAVGAIAAAADASTAVGSLLPVLSARSEAIDDEIAAQLGETTVISNSSKRYDRLGWNRGEHAADRAEINPAVRGQRGSCRPSALAAGDEY